MKALKRALSLSRVFLLGTADDEIVTLLREEQGALAAAIAAREELLTDLTTQASAIPKRYDVLTDALRRSIEDLKNKQADGSVTDCAEEWANNLVAPYLQRLVTNVQALIRGVNIAGLDRPN